MLKSNHSLKLRKDFNAVYRYGKKSRGEYGVLISLFQQESDKQSLFKIGFVISKKFGNAVVRNKHKRRLKALTQSYIDASEIDLNGKFIYVAYSKPDSYEQLQSHFHELLNKAFQGK